MLYIRVRNRLLIYKVIKNSIIIFRKYYIAFYYKFLQKESSKKIYNACSDKDKNILTRGMFYHDFELLGFKTWTRFFGIENQIAKNQYILRYIDYAVENYNIKNGIELFCADGYFSNYIAQYNVQMEGVDLEIVECQGASTLYHAELITRVLHNEHKIIFKKDDVFNIDKSYDIALCIGGLYHIENPLDLLKLLSSKSKFLLLQTVYSLNVEEKYFITPTPGWGWGCRFSYEYLENMLLESGWNIVLSNKNELPENHLDRDRGSAYIFCTSKEL